LRTPQETVNAVEQQLWAACSGIQSSVDALQTQTGVKDKIAQHWINILVPTARQLLQQALSNPTTSGSYNRNTPQHKEDLTAAIQQVLFRWLIQQPPERYNALSLESGKDSYFHYINFAYKYTELRKKLRPGDHYNHMLVVEGEWLL
jgi:hypothetical protein